MLMMLQMEKYKNSIAFWLGKFNLYAFPQKFDKFEMSITNIHKNVVWSIGHNDNNSLLVNWKH